MNNKDIRAKLLSSASSVEVPDVRAKVLEKTASLPVKEYPKESQPLYKKKWFIPGLSMSLAAVVAGVSIGVYFGNRKPETPSLALTPKMNEEEKNAFKDEALMTSSLAVSYLPSSEHESSLIKRANGSSSSDSEEQDDFLASLKKYLNLLDSFFYPPEIREYEDKITWTRGLNEYSLSYTETKKSAVRYDIGGTLEGKLSSFEVTGSRYLDEEKKHHVDLNLSYSLLSLEVRTSRTLGEENLTSISVLKDHREITECSYSESKNGNRISYSLSLNFGTMTFIKDEDEIDGKYVSSSHDEFNVDFTLKKKDENYYLTWNGLTISLSL